jgi:diguanylate cyclase (GGDEF)-like protein/PAS domain S-box-containing protein
LPTSLILPSALALILVLLLLLFRQNRMLSRSMASLRQEEKLRLAAKVFAHTREGIIITDADGRVVDANRAFTEITGYSREEILGQNPSLLSSGRQDPEFYANMWRELIENGHWHGEVWNRRKDGELYAEMLTISAMHDDQGKVQHYVALFSDVTLQKEHQQQLEYIAHYDPLTGLPNRLLLSERLNSAMQRARRLKRPLVVAYIDLDGFKAVNDTHGHSVGDRMLRALAKRMKRSLREGATLARPGGDEFVAVLNDLPDSEASLPMVLDLLATAAEPVHIDGQRLQLSASLGMTFFPQAEEVNADQLLRQADQAMYQAKLAGKNRYHVFDAEQDRHVRGRHESLEDIRRGLREGEFVLHYQPKVHLRSGDIVGCEALIRWQHRDKGLLSPAAFLPIIEEHPLAIALGEWVIDTALRQMETWYATGLDLPVSVNISAFHLQQGDFMDRLNALLAAHPDVNHGCLELEVLETSALEDMAHISGIMARCEMIGVQFALDDFGTGYSSLTYLKRLPATHLKIDQSFVRGMLDDPEDLAIIEGVLGLANAFRREVIAEGVETVAHGELLLQLGCEIAQGYAIARPMPADDFREWTKSWQPDPAWRRHRRVRRDNLPVLFAGVEHRAWIQAIEDCLRGERTSAPPLDHHKCRFGHWLDSQGREAFRGHPALEELGALHLQVHALASELLGLQAGQRTTEALARLEELRNLSDALSGQLQRLLATDGG